MTGRPIVLVLAILLAGCGSIAVSPVPSPSPVPSSAPTASATPAASPSLGAIVLTLTEPVPVHVEMSDASGTLVAAREATANERAAFTGMELPGAATLHGDPKSLVLGYVDGDCDDHDEVHINANVSAIDVQVVHVVLPDTTPPQACEAIGYVRDIILTFSSAAPTQPIMVTSKEIWPGAPSPSPSSPVSPTPSDAPAFVLTLNRPREFPLTVRVFDLTGRMIRARQSARAETAGLFAKNTPRLLSGLSRDTLIAAWMGGGCVGSDLPMTTDLTIGPAPDQISFNDLPIAWPSPTNGVVYGCFGVGLDRFVTLTFAAAPR